MAGYTQPTPGKGDRLRLGKLRDVAAEVWYQLMPFPRLLKFNRIVAASLKVETPGERQKLWVGLGRDKLLVLMAEEWGRATSLDEKLFKLTTALSVAVTAVGVASKAVLDALAPGGVRTGFLIVILYVIVSLFGGALMGFSGLRPKPRRGYGPDFALLIRHNNRAAAEAIADALYHFEVTNILRANDASAANLAIRNGVTAFALAMTFSLFVPAKPPPPQPPPAQPSTQVIIHSHAPSESPPLSVPSSEGPVVANDGAPAVPPTKVGP